MSFGIAIGRNMLMDEDEFDFDTYGGGVEFYGKLDTDDREEIFLERRSDRIVREGSD